jgi:hypothetical protein
MEGTARAMESTTSVTQHWLGLEPYVLLTFRKGDQGPDDMRAGIESGGGIENTEDVGTALAITLSGLDAQANPFDQDLTALAGEHPEYAEAVAAIRQRFGWGGPA